MRIVVIPTDAPPYSTDIGQELKALQAVVGGYIEPIDLGDAVGWCNEEGKILGLPANPYATALCRNLDAGLQPGDVIAGTFFITGDVDAEGEYHLDVPGHIATMCGVIA